MHSGISQPLPLSAPARNLQRLCLIRLIAWAGQTSATAYAFWSLRIELPYPALTIVLLLSLSLIIFSLLRSRHPWPVTDIEFFLHILIDILIVWVLMYLTGGASNPFVSYFLVPLTISAATLSWYYSGAIMLLALTAYSSLLSYYVPVELLSPAHHAEHDSGLNWHILGMWINFVISAGLISFFIVRMANSLRQQDRILQAAREKQLRNEHIVGIATMAANTAHALGTPLSTMAVLLNEMAHKHYSNEQAQENISLLRRQVSICKDNLRELVQASERLQQKQYTTLPADKFFIQLLEQWRSRRPAVNYSFGLSATTPAPEIFNAPPLIQALQNLLDNAADASPGHLDISADWNNTTVSLKIRDYGSGIAPGLADQMGKPFFSTKSGGLGLGLFLSHATLDLFAGTIQLHNHADGGTLTEVCMPVAD